MTPPEVKWPRRRCVVDVAVVLLAVALLLVSLVFVVGVDRLGPGRSS